MTTRYSATEFPLAINSIRSCELMYRHSFFVISVIH